MSTHTLSGSEVPPADLPHLGLTVDPDSGRLRDALGRCVTMRGLNTGGRAKWAPFFPFPLPDPNTPEAFRAAADTFFGRLNHWGLDTARLTFSWEALEPTRGAFDGAYLDRYAAMVDSAGAQGIRVIVDFHQDVYAGPFSGDGFPLWTLEDPDPGPSRCDDPFWFARYVQDKAVQRAYDRFWANEDGIQTAFEGMWRHMARRFAAHPAVVGFEIINEPGWGSVADIDAWKRDVLTPFHTRLAALVRAEAPNKLVFFDGPGIDALSPKVHYVRPEGDGLVYAPHLYDTGLIMGQPWTGAEPEAPLASMADFAKNAGLGLLLGEFGVGDGAEGGAEWLRRTMEALDAHRISATLWEYSQNETLWNGEDLSVVTFEGQERAILDTYVRPWLRALAGRAPTFTWHPELARAEVRWTADEGVTEIMVPRRLFPNGIGVFEGDGDGLRATYDEARGELRVTANAGAAVGVVFGPVS